MTGLYDHLAPPFLQRTPSRPPSLLRSPRSLAFFSALAAFPFSSSSSFWSSRPHVTQDSGAHHCNGVYSKTGLPAGCELTLLRWNPSSSWVPRVLADFFCHRSGMDMGGPLSHLRAVVAVHHPCAPVHQRCKDRQRGQSGTERELGTESQVSLLDPTWVH